MPYYARLARLGNGQSPVNAAGIPRALTPPSTVSIPSGGGVPSVSAPAASTAGMPPGTVLQYSARVILAAHALAFTPQQIAAMIGDSLSKMGVQLAGNTMPNFGLPAKSYAVALTVQLLNSFPTTESVQGAIDQAVNQVPGIAVLSSAAAVAGTSVAGQSLGPATPPPSALDNLAGFVRKNWQWLAIGAALWVGISESRKT